MTALSYRHFSLSDGTRLAYLDIGTGAPIVMLAGWSQSVAQYKHQVEALSRDHRVVAMDWRGHGRSDKPDGGYRVVRFAADLREFITGLGLKDITFPCPLGRRVGGLGVPGRLRDRGHQAPDLHRQGDSRNGEAGVGSSPSDVRGSSILVLDGLKTFYETVLGSSSVPETAEMLRRLFSTDFPADELTWVAEENLRLPRPHAAALLWDIALDDWSDLFRRIELPALVVGAEASLYSAASRIP